MKFALKPVECSLLYQRRMEEKPSWLISAGEASNLNELLSNISVIKPNSSKIIPNFPSNSSCEQNKVLHDLSPHSQNKSITNW